MVTDSSSTLKTGYQNASFWLYSFNTLYIKKPMPTTARPEHSSHRLLITVLRLAWSGDLAPGAPVCIDWAVQDDGAGLARPALAQQQGNGLSGIQERVWAQGGELRFGPGLAGHGLGLSARFQSHWRWPQAAADGIDAGQAEVVR